MNEEIRKKYQGSFATHKATLIQDNDRYLAIDWRKSNGSGDYYANYILDKKRGSIIISGDLGDCIATWYNKLNVANAKSYIDNVDYFIGKIQCSTDKYTYYDDDVIADIREKIENSEIDISDVYNIELGIFDMDDFWQAIEDEVAESTSRLGMFFPTDKLVKMMEMINCDYYEWLYSCGERIHPRVYLWAIGFQMACDQLGL